MTLQTTFIEAARTVFEVFASLVHDSVYIQVEDDGFGTGTPVETPVGIIHDSFSKNDVQVVPFADLIQPTDIKGLILGEELTVELSTRDMVRDNSTGEEYSVVAWTTDPARAVVTVLLRKA